MGGWEPHASVIIFMKIQEYIQENTIPTIIVGIYKQIQLTRPELDRINKFPPIVR